MKEKRPVVVLTGTNTPMEQNLIDRLSEFSDVTSLVQNADQKENAEHHTAHPCDLFSLQETQKALEGADYAIYIHSPAVSTAQLTQAKDKDIDIILADNFARAARDHSIKHILYVSDAIPSNVSKRQRSRRLRSRLEVERTLQQYGVPASTFQMEASTEAKKPPFPRVKTLVKRLTTIVPRQLESRNDGMSENKAKVKNDVRSLQRMPLPQGTDAQWVAREYPRWLADIGSPLLRVEMDAHSNVQIKPFLRKWTLLQLTFSTEQGTADHALFHITGGLFVNARSNDRARLEFREIPQSREIIIAIHDYVPSLPWFLYKITQAKLHMLVMVLFKLHLQRLMGKVKGTTRGYDPLQTFCEGRG
ncbi:hypothetical protein [Shouchella shacheensis]|uniref:hypothetical protein n=1 Tax=Shouchella shacheensis TaxID=1649580 RepID=UPI00073FBDDB|nr:hypothetical protein [Shouchella shacheensis]